MAWTAHEHSHSVVAKQARAYREATESDSSSSCNSPVAPGKRRRRRRSVGPGCAATADQPPLPPSPPSSCCLSKAPHFSDGLDAMELAVRAAKKAYADAMSDKEEEATTCSTVASESDIWPVTDSDLEGALPTAVPERPCDTLQDVVVDASGAVALLPVGGHESRLLCNLPDDELVTVRVFRFFEDPKDERHQWEKELRNVNSGSLLWLVAHLEPKMHSVLGAKYGKWFTVHHIRLLAKHFRSNYHMCEEGSCPLAKTFGATSGINMLVTGQRLPTGYLWFVSPDGAGSGASCKDVGSEENLQERGWQHVTREGPFEGDLLLDEWRRQGSPMDELHLQQILGRLTQQARAR